MDHDPAPQSLGDLAAAPQAVNGSAVLRERSGSPGDTPGARAAHEARTGRPDRSGRPSMTVRPSPVSLVALGPGAAPHTGPSCARNPAPTAPVSPKASATTLGGGPVCVWTVYGSCLRSWSGSSSHLTQTEVGCQEKRRVCVRQPYSVFTCGCSCFSSCTGRDVTRQQTRRGRERPPLICRWHGSAKGAVSATVSGTVSDTHPRLWGRSRRIYPCYMDSSIYARASSILEG